jgi:WD40 repeat protein
MFVTCNANGRVEAWAQPWDKSSVERDVRCPGVRDFQFTHDGRSIVAVGSGIRFLNVDSGSAGDPINPDRTYDYVAIAAGVDRFAAADQERRVTIGTVHSSDPPRDFDSGLPLLSNSSVSLSYDGTTLAMAESRGNTLLLVDTATLKPREILEPEFSRMVAFPPVDGPTFAYSKKSGSLEVRSRQAKEPAWTMEVPYVDFESLTYSPDGKLLATSSSDRVIRILNAETGKVEHELLRNPRPIESLTFSPDSRTLASLDDEGALKLWHVGSGRLMMDLEAEPHAGRAEMCRFSPDGMWLAHTHEGDTIRLLQLHRPEK